MDIGNVTQVANQASDGVKKNELNGDAFLTLLVAQLRAQDPFDPVSAADFVAQLVQFNSLDQLIRIRQAIEENPGGEAAANLLNQS